MRIDGDNRFLKQYLARTQVDVSVAAYTKVPQDWRDFNFKSDFNRFYYIREGDGYLKVRDSEFTPVPGQLYLLPAGELLSYSTVSDDTFGKYWCHFTAKVGDLSLFNVLELPFFINVDYPDALTGLFEELILHMNSQELSSAFRVKAIMLELVAYYLEKSASRKFNLNVSSSIEKINAVLDYMEANLSEQVTVDDLARMAHFHPNYFIQRFKHFTGSSPIQYMNRLRIDRAKHLLTGSDWSVSRIADAIGMQLFYFSRMFKEQTGYSPTSYRSMSSRGTDGS